MQHTVTSHQHSSHRCGEVKAVNWIWLRTGYSLEKKVNISLLALRFGCIVGQKVGVTGWLLYRARQQKPILYPSFDEWTPPMQTLLHVTMNNSTNAVLLTINPRHASAEGYSSCACCVLVRFDFSIQY